ncbi:MAG: glutamate--tRNA ligase [Gammaproteobacteria bacterium]|nr:glutamate--tRNA ligase [Gammaproteobacteria bacterium]
MKAKSRFCPSPTGYVHLGNARTALFNALLAKQKEGIFLLRIEDTDVTRSKKEYEEALELDLNWLGLCWDEGPHKDLNHGPYCQSERQEVYDHYYTLLEQQEKAYPCFCTEEELALMRKVQRASGRPPRYAGTCLGLSQEKIQEKMTAGMKPTLRFHVPNDCTIEFDDAVRGLQRFSGSDIGDFIIRRADGTSPFMFCNAIDDALMEVTYALRGEDHLTNTPRQVLILQALQLPIPTYGHISLIVGDDGSPLSKRHGSRSIRELRESGFFPEAVNNYMARLGHYYENDTYMSLDELAGQFKLTNLGKSPARFDYQQLLRWQQEAISRKQSDALWEWMSESTRHLVPEAKREMFITTIKSNITFPEDAEKYALIFFSSDKRMLLEEQKKILQEAGPNFFRVAIDAVEDQGQNFRAISEYLQERLQVKGKGLFQPLRIALTGELHGPEMAAIFRILPVSEIITRLNLAQQNMAN